MNSKNILYIKGIKCEEDYVLKKQINVLREFYNKNFFENHKILAIVYSKGLLESNNG